MLKRLLLSGAAASGLLFASAAHAIVIDSFSEGPQNVNVNPASVTTYDAGNTATLAEVGNFSSIFGGYREVSATVTAIAGVGTKNLDVYVAHADAGLVFDHSQGSAVSAFTYVVWDGQGSGGTGGLSIAPNGEDHFEIDLAFGDVVITWQLILTDTDGFQASHTFTSPGDVGGPTTLPIGFNQFTGLDGIDAVNIDSIDRIEFYANFSPTRQGVDTTVLEIRTDVPEPVMLGLFGLGLLGAGVVGRRKLR